MEFTDQEKKIIKEAFVSEALTDLICRLIQNKIDYYNTRLLKAMKEIDLRLVNGAVISLNEFRDEIRELHKTAVSERPFPLDQA